MLYSPETQNIQSSDFNMSLDQHMACNKVYCSRVLPETPLMRLHYKLLPALIGLASEGPMMSHSLVANWLLSFQLCASGVIQCALA